MPSKRRSAEGGDERPATASRLTRAFQHRNFRLFFGGQSLSLIGTWITRVATSWLVYRLTGSELLLGVAGFAGQIPMLVVSPLAGVLVDRVDRRRLLLVTQAASLLQSAGLAALTLLGVITVPQIIGLQVIQGVINAFDTPARQAFVSEMIADPSHLPNAIALNSSMVNASRILGPSIAGALILLVGEGWCFTVDALSYVAVIASLLLMRVAPRAASGAVRLRILAELGHGWGYVARSVPIRTVLLLVAIMSFAGTPYAVLMPAIATRGLHGGPGTLGVLMATAGVGALAGGLYLASRASVLGLGRVITVAAITFGVGLVAFSFARTVWLACVPLVLVGGGFVLQLAGSNTILQTLVDEHLRGRIMAFYTMAFLGTVPLGSLAGGAIAEHFGPAITVRLCGVVCILAGVWFATRLPAIRDVVRPLYVARGILGDAPAREGDEPR